MKGKNVFVSGGAGVIGLEVVSRLVARGANVLIGDLKPRPNSLPTSVKYRQGDINTMTRLELELFQPEIIIHLAATFERSDETYDFWDECFWHNVHLSHHLMTISKDLPTLKRVVFASSYLIYDPQLYQFDTPQKNPIILNESDSISPRNLTGMAKLAHEKELHFLEKYRNNQFTAVCARIFRGYGCGSHDIISRWIRMLLNDETITIYRPEGKFDYIYAADSAEGLIRLGENNNITGIINLGSGRSRSVQEIVDILREYFPSMKAVEIESDIPFESSQADMTMYHTEMGWLPEYDLEKAIQEMIAYEKSRYNENES